MKQQRFLTVVGTLLCCVLMVMPTLTSCDNLIYDDLQPCPRGFSMRFVYDYNMEYANAFPKKVDCLTLLFYDDKGNYLGKRTETTEVLADENYRMVVDLPEGKYHVVAYGGLACEESSFIMSVPEVGLAALQVEMQHNNLTSDKALHGLFYGAMDVTIDSEMYKDVTLYMMKDTNNIRIVLQQLSGDPVNVEDFSAYITDDNTLFAYDNSLISQGQATYLPWAQGQRTAGIATRDAEAGDEVKVAYYEFSTSRLMIGNSPRLVIKRNDLGTDIVNIPLNSYLLLLKSDLYADMGNQEYLDRESEWSMVFLLDTKHAWIKTQVIINDWIVRLNDTDF